MNCPHCHKKIEVQQSRAAKSRWSKLTKSERKQEMSRRRIKGMNKTPKPYTKEQLMKKGGPKWLSNIDFNSAK